MAKGNSAKGKGEKREETERKRDERSRRRGLKKEREIEEYLENDENFVSFRNQLEIIGLKIKDILGDGNCLFRALGDQFNGDHTSHAYHRKNTVQYMKNNRSDFEPFMEDGVTFEKHLKELAVLGTYGGNDSIVAFARNNGVDIVIHQLNNPRWVINGSEYSKSKENIELHLAYHNGDHYSSVRRASDPDDGPAWKYFKKTSLTPLVSSKEDGTRSKRKKDKTKKNNIQESPSLQATCFPGKSKEVVGPEQIVMDATGCQDLELIIQTLQENHFDIDVSIGYVLQMMCILEDQGCNNARECVSNTKDKSKDILNDEKVSWINVGKDFNEAKQGEATNITYDEETSEEKSNLQSNEEKIENNFIEGSKETLNKKPLEEFVHNLKKSLPSNSERRNVVNNRKLDSGARPKKPTTNNSSKPTAHLTNRKRKDLAKLEKKKRRDERRIEEQKESESATREILENGTSGVVVGDLGAVSI